MNWYWIHAYCGETCIGSTYTPCGSRENVTRVLNEEFGEGNWTRYTIE